MWENQLRTEEHPLHYMVKAPRPPELRPLGPCPTASCADFGLFSVCASAGSRLDMCLLFHGSVSRGFCCRAGVSLVLFLPEDVAEGRLVFV